MLVPASLQATLISAFKKAQADKSDSAQANLCSDLANAIDAYIKTATVTTTGTAAAQTGILT